jgi:hypothetical protein
MSKISGESGQKDLHVRASPIPFRQPVDGEGVSQVMKPRLTRTHVATANSRKNAQPSEVSVYRGVTQTLMLPRLEKWQVGLITSSRRGYIPSKDLD